MTTVKDPICGMMVEKENAKYKSEYQGETYYFCNAACKSTFDEDPAMYTKGSGQSGKHSGGCCCCGGH
jgi:YHS domain-containing protein